MKRISLNKLLKLKGSNKPRKRVGRGQGSGKGSHTTGRGAKGQKIRGKVRLYFEGGQLPISKRLPHQRGTQKPFQADHHALRISAFNVFTDGQSVGVEVLRRRGLIKRGVSKVKIIRGGSLSRKLKLYGFSFSKGALNEAAKSGSTVKQFGAV